LRWAQPRLTGKPLESIDRAKLEALAKLKEQEGAAPGTVNRYLASISAVLGHAVTQNMLATAPRVPKRREPEKRVRWATQAQAEILIAALPTHWQPIARFSLATGLRKFNATHLQWQNVDIKRRIAWVHAEEAKGGRTISIPLNNDA